MNPVALDTISRVYPMQRYLLRNSVVSRITVLIINLLLFGGASAQHVNVTQLAGNTFVLENSSADFETISRDCAWRPDSRITRRITFGPAGQKTIGAKFEINISMLTAYSGDSANGSRRCREHDDRSWGKSEIVFAIDSTFISTQIDSSDTSNIGEKEKGTVEVLDGGKTMVLNYSDGEKRVYRASGMVNIAPIVPSLASKKIGWSCYVGSGAANLGQTSEMGGGFVLRLDATRLHDVKPDEYTISVKDGSVLILNRATVVQNVPFELNTRCGRLTILMDRGSLYTINYQSSIF